MICLNCGDNVIGKGISFGKFCCEKCKWTWMNNNRTLKPNVFYECIVCGGKVEKYISPSRFKEYTFQFCSRSCKGKYMSGDKHPLWVGGKENHKKPDPPKPNYIGMCDFCGIKFETYRNKSQEKPKFCSVQCTGFAQRGENNPAYNGGRYKCNGYYVVFSPNHPYATKKKLVLEHRLVMEKKIGRYLKKNESVHHIDGNKLNNSSENLMLFKNNSEHMKYHAKLRKENK